MRQMIKANLTTTEWEMFSYCLLSVEEPNNVDKGAATLDIMDEAGIDSKGIYFTLIIWGPIEEEYFKYYLNFTGITMICCMASKMLGPTLMIWTLIMQNSFSSANLEKP